MPSTYLSLHFHIVFSTKGRVPSIEPSWRFDLHAYLGGIVRGLGGVADSVGGVADHVHLLIGLKATHCLSDVVREIKKASSVWIHEKIGVGGFAWQEGYAAFTVSPTARHGVKKYVANQHHRTKTCREELVELLENAGIEYDPRYLD